MELVILGSGTCVPSLKRSSPAYFLAINGKEVLVDCGSGAMHQMLRAGKRLENLDALFLTHFHMDHLGDLPPLIHALNHAPGMKRKKTLSLVGPRGLSDYCGRILFQTVSQPDGYEIDILEVEPLLSFDGYEVLSVSTAHAGESVAYRFTPPGENKAVVFSGDTDDCPEILAISRNADILVLECSFPDEEKMAGHLTPSECGKIAASAGVKKLVLSHFYGTCSEDRIFSQCRRFFEGDLVLASDLMVLHV
jgi:ribonuclease BN (tRNA processing enzyme)